MKDFIVIIVIIAIIFGGGYLLSEYFQNSGDEVLNMIEELSVGFEDDDEAESEEKIDKIKDRWEELQTIWITFQYHESVSNVNELIVECCNYYKTKNREQFDISYEKMQKSIENLRNREKIAFFNLM